MVELHFLVSVLAASQCLLWYKNKLSVFSSLLKEEKINQTTHLYILKAGWQEYVTTILKFYFLLSKL